MHRRVAGVPPARQLAGFIARFTPEIASLARASVATMRKRLPGAQVLVYDNYKALATATKAIPSKGRSPIVIKSISAKQRPRRPQASSGQ